MSPPAICCGTTPRRSQDQAREAADAELQALHVVHRLDFLAEPAAHLAAGAAEDEGAEVVFLVELVDQLVAAAEIAPGVVLALVHGERQAGLEHEVRMLAEVVVGGGLAGLDGAVLHGVGDLQARDDFAGGEGADLELAVRHLADHLGEQLGAAVERVERLGEARRQTPLHFRHALRDRRCGHGRCRRDARRAHACRLDELPTLHSSSPPYVGTFSDSPLSAGD